MLPLDGYYEYQDSSVINFADGLHYIIPQQEPFQYGSYKSVTHSGDEMIKSMNLQAENLASLENIMNQAAFFTAQTAVPGQINLQSALQANEQKQNAPAAAAAAPAGGQAGVGQGGRGKGKRYNTKQKRVKKVSFKNPTIDTGKKVGFGKSSSGGTGRAEPGIPRHYEEINLVGFLDGIDPAQRLRNQAFTFNS